MQMTYDNVCTLVGRLYLSNAAELDKLIKENLELLAKVEFLEKDAKSGVDNK